MVGDTLALVGAAGGVGTTRVTLACATLLARNGRDVAVLDAAYETQGLADRTPGRIDSDMTELCLEGGPLERGLVDIGGEGAGRVAVCPARAPFERIARAKTPAAASAFESRVAEASRAFEFVVVDTPPIAANQAVAAVNSVEAVAVVCDGARAEAAVPRMVDRLADTGIDDPTVVVTHESDHPDADVAIPELETEFSADGSRSAAFEELDELLEKTVGADIDPDDGGGLRSKLGLQ